MHSGYNMNPHHIGCWENQHVWSVCNSAHKVLSVQLPFAFSGSFLVSPPSRRWQEVGIETKPASLHPQPPVPQGKQAQGRGLWGTASNSTRWSLGRGSSHPMTDYLSHSLLLGGKRGELISLGNQQPNSRAHAPASQANTDSILHGSLLPPSHHSPWLFPTMINPGSQMPSISPLPQPWLDR